MKQTAYKIGTFDNRAAVITSASGNVISRVNAITALGNGCSVILTVAGPSFDDVLTLTPSPFGTPEYVATMNGTEVFRGRDAGGMIQLAVAWLCGECRPTSR